MNGVGLPTVGQRLGHRRRETTALYVHFDDAALRDAATQVASLIAQAMRFPVVAEKNYKDAARRGLNERVHGAFEHTN